MEKVVGIVKESHGRFYAKDTQGNIRELQSGDEVYENETILPDTQNNQNNTLTITLNNGAPALVITNQEQTIDKEFLDSTLSNNELVFNPTNIEVSPVLNDPEDTNEKFIQLTGNQTDINSDLRSSYWGIQEYIQIQEGSTEESISQSGLTFNSRDGDSTDVVSDLNEALWDNSQDEPIYNGEIQIDIPNNIDSEDHTPIAVNDTKVVLTEGTSEIQSAQLLTNDISIDGKSLYSFTYNSITYTFNDNNASYTISTSVGELTVNNNGTWELDASSIVTTEHILDSFTYKIIDDDGDISNSATQEFLIFDSDMATNISTSTDEDTFISIILNDTAGDITITDTSSTNTKTLSSGESIDITNDSGEVIAEVVNNGDGSITFIPAEHYSGTDAEFSYELVRSDNTTIINDSVSVEVTAIAETDINDTDDNNSFDVITQGDMTYSTINESSSYGFISLENLSVTNEDDINNSSNIFASETTEVKLSGVPVGFVFSYFDGSNTIEVTVSDETDGVTIPAEYIDTLQVKPTDYYSGDIEIKMEVITTDGSSTYTSNEDYLRFTITSVADGVTINAAQSTGYEDAGRSNGNMANDSTASEITNPSEGIPLDITVSTTDTSGSEEFTIIISDIPDGGSIYYSDDNGSILIDETGTITGSNENVTVLANDNGTWELTIKDFDNDATLNFIPEHNTSGDYTFSIVGYSTDGDDISEISSPVYIDVSIEGVADIPIYETLNSVDSNGDVNSDDSENIYNAVVVEDNSNTTNGATISLIDLYEQAGLDSYDSDGSETLSIVITGLSTEFSVTDADGISFNAGSGTSREWSLDLEDLDSVIITTDENFSGTINFTVKYITTESDGDSNVVTQDVSILVTPLVEANITTNASATEDEISLVDFSIVYENGDSTETLDEVWIKIEDITNKDFTLYTDDSASSELSTNGTTITLDSSGQYYILTDEAITSVYIKYDDNIGSADTTDTSFEIKYTVSDSVTVNSETLTDTNTEVSGVYNISLLSVTDTTSVTTSNVTAVDSTDITYDNSTTIPSITINSTGSFTVDVNISGDSDTDGSESVTRIVIEGGANRCKC